MTAIGTAALDLAGAVARAGGIELVHFQHFARLAYARAPTTSEAALLSALTAAVYEFHTSEAGVRQGIAFHVVGAASMYFAAFIALRDSIPVNVFDALAVGAYVGELGPVEAVDQFIQAIEATEGPTLQ